MRRLDQEELVFIALALAAMWLPIYLIVRWVLAD